MHNAKGYLMDKSHQAVDDVVIDVLTACAQQRMSLQCMGMATVYVVDVSLIRWNRWCIGPDVTEGSL